MPLSPHLDVSDGVKTVQLVQQLQHCTLNLPLTTAVCVVSLRANRVNLICTGLKGQNAQSTGWGMGSARGREGNTAGVGTSKRSVNGPEERGVQEAEGCADAGDPGTRFL